MDTIKSCREYCCQYYHDGSWWGLNIMAYNAADAEARIAKLGNLKLLGELIMKIPAGRPWITDLICRIRNFLFSP